jgi:hypothetical protein
MNDFYNHAKSLLPLLNENPDAFTPDSNTTKHKNPLNEIDGKIHRDQSIDEIIEKCEDNIEGADQASRAYPMEGIEILAFYKSFRFKNHSPFNGLWGIFLLDVGVDALHKNFIEIDETINSCEAKRIAVQLLVEHERYHYWIDTWTFAIEASSISKYKLFEPYKKIKNSIELTDEDHEESLANHFAFERLKRIKLSNGSTATKILKETLRTGPTPYNNFCYSQPDRIKRETELGLSIRNSLPPTASYAFQRLAGLENSTTQTVSCLITPSITTRRHPITGITQCPIHLITTSNYSKIISPYLSPDLSEMERFIKNYLSGEFVSHSNHENYRIDNGSLIRLPNPHSKTIRNYELSGTLKLAGMTTREFGNERIRTKSWKKRCPRSEIKPARS